MTDTTNTTTYTIEAYTLDYAIKLIDKYNKKADKHGMNKITYTYGEKYVKTRRVYQVDGDHMVRGTYEVDVMVIDFTVDNVVTNFEGWDFIGMTELVDGVTTLVNFKNDETIDLSKFRGSQTCDHCGHNRKRNKVFLISNDGGKTIKQVGSSCVKDFISGEAGDLVKYFEFLKDLNEKLECCDWEEVERGGRAVSLYKVKEILENTLIISEAYGYVTVKASSIDPCKLSTRNRVIDATLGKVDDIWGDIKRDLNGKDWDTVVEKASKEADAIIKWVEEMNTDGHGAKDFLDTVKEAIKVGSVSQKLFGYIVGVVAFWNRHNAEVAKKKESNKVESKHIGTIGQRCEFEGVIEKIIPFESYYGSGNITKINCDGNIVSYFNLIKVKGKVAEEGVRVKFWANPKKHDEYRNVKQTVVSRATKCEFV